MAIKAFTAVTGIGTITTGVCVESYTLESGESIPAILVGRSDEPGFLPIENCRLYNQEGNAHTHVEAVTLDIPGDAADGVLRPKLVACWDKEEIDENQALVVFRAEPPEDGEHEETTYYRGDTELSGSDIWRSLGRGGVVPIRPSAEMAGVGTAQFIQVLGKGDKFSVWASNANGLHAECYEWDGADVLWQGKNTIRL